MKVLIALISKTPDQMRAEYYEGMSLDVSKISSSEPILMSIWPCLVLFDVRMFWESA